ncbi:MAG: rhamnogalacturonan acetylesterase [Christensenellaceae bacterium]
MINVYLVGDSTTCYYDLTVEDRDFLYPRNGYGMWLKEYFSDQVKIINLALSGRSSKSFLQEENYKVLCENLGEGDYLFIAFGHNDEKYKDELRFTYGGGDVSDSRSFKYSLYENYIRLAKSVKATPVLVSSIVRRSPENKFVGDRVHKLGEVCVNGTVFPSSDYALATKELAKECGLHFIDMTGATKRYYEKIGADESRKLHATLSFDEFDTDNTHLNSFGAQVISGIFIEELKKLGTPLNGFIVRDNPEADFNSVITNKKP